MFGFTFIKTSDLRQKEKQISLLESEIQSLTSKLNNLTPKRGKGGRFAPKQSN